MKIYSYSRCSTCRKALKWLDQKNIEYYLIDIVKKPPSKQQISEAIRQLEDRKLVLNTSGKSYRSIGADSIKAMSDSKLIDLMSKDGGLIKRPFVVNNDSKVIVGFNEASWENFFLN